MPESAATQILQTTVVEEETGASRVDIVLSDAAKLEDAKQSIVLSVRVEHPPGLPLLALLQNKALYNAVSLIREHTNRLDEVIAQARRGDF